MATVTETSHATHLDATIEMIEKDVEKNPQQVLLGPLLSGLKPYLITMN